MKLVAKIFLAIVLVISLSLATISLIVGLWAVTNYNGIVNQMLSQYPMRTLEEIQGMLNFSITFYFILFAYTIVSSGVILVTVFRYNHILTRKQALPFGILNIIFGSLVAGILLLVMNEDDLAKVTEINKKK